MDDDSLLLTDDEVVALGLSAGQLWPAALPSVDVQEDAAVSAAGFRGNRSLVVRGLRTEDGTSHAETTAAGVLGAERRVNVYLGDHDYRVTSYAISSAHHRGPSGDWLFETVSVVGVHRLAARPVDDHRAYLRALLEAAVAHGPEPDGSGEGGASWFCVTAETAASGAIVAARRSEVLMGELLRTDTGPRASALAPIEVDEAVSALLGEA